MWALVFFRQYFTLLLVGRRFCSKSHHNHFISMLLFTLLPYVVIIVVFPHSFLFISIRVHFGRHMRQSIEQNFSHLHLFRFFIWLNGQCRCVFFAVASFRCLCEHWPSARIIYSQTNTETTEIQWNNWFLFPIFYVFFSIRIVRFQTNRTGNSPWNICCYKSISPNVIMTNFHLGKLKLLNAWNEREKKSEIIMNTKWN